LQVETVLAARAISAMFPEIHNIGGFGRMPGAGIPTVWLSTS
jgi:hypothetical protein